MELQDTLPERRNLIVISTLFILYFYAGGEFSNSEVKLAIVNITFNKPWVLVLFAWLSLFYCLLRYWLVTRGEFEKDFHTESLGFIRAPKNMDFIVSRCPVKIDGWNGSYTYCFSDVSYKGFLLQAKVTYRRTNLATHPTQILDDNIRKIEYRLRKSGEPPEYVIRFNDIYGAYLSIYAFIRALISKPSATLFITPYLLFVLAVCGLTVD